MGVIVAIRQQDLGNIKNDEQSGDGYHASE